MHRLLGFASTWRRPSRYDLRMSLTAALTIGEAKEGAQAPNELDTYHTSMRHVMHVMLET